MKILFSAYIRTVRRKFKYLSINKPEKVNIRGLSEQLYIYNHLNVNYGITKVECCILDISMNKTRKNYLDFSDIYRKNIYKFRLVAKHKGKSTFEVYDYFSNSHYILVTTKLIEEIGMNGEYIGTMYICINDKINNSIQNLKYRYIKI